MKLKIETEVALFVQSSFIQLSMLPQECSREHIKRDTAHKRTFSTKGQSVKVRRTHLSSAAFGEWAQAPIAP